MLLDCRMLVRCEVIGLVYPDPGWNVIHVWLKGYGQVWRCFQPTVLACGWPSSLLKRSVSCESIHMVAPSLLFYPFSISMALCVYGKEFFMFHEFIAIRWLMLHHCWDQITHFEGTTEGGSQFPLCRRDSSLTHGLTHLSPSQKPQTYSTWSYRIPHSFLLFFLNYLSGIKLLVP